MWLEFDDGTLLFRDARDNVPHAEWDDRVDEYVTFENIGEQPLDLGGWMVANGAGTTYTVPDGVMLEPGNELTLHTGSGSDSASDLYWGSSQPIWNNGGDTVTVEDGSGTLVTSKSY